MKRRITDYNAAPLPGDGRTVGVVNRWMRSKVSLGVSGFIAVCIVAAIVVSFFLPPPAPSTPLPDRLEVVAEPSVSVAPAVSGCLEQEAVELLPEQVLLTSMETIWYRVGDMLAPSSQTGGPTVTDPLPACFPRNPEGALYAAANFAAGIIAATAQDTDRDFYIARASHTGNYNLLLAELASSGQVTNRPTIKITGYQWNSYSPHIASVRIKYALLTGSRAGTDVAVTYTMTWENNDWLLVIPGKADTVSVDPTATTYTPWGSS